MKYPLILLICLVVASACAKTPLGRSQFTMLSDSQVAQMGDSAFLNVKNTVPLEQDRDANAYVACVAHAIVRNVGGQWEVAVFRQENPNAFALPGGKIGVYSGILKVAINQDQLATVLAHEVAHVLARHTNERVSQQMAMSQTLNVIQAVANPTSGTGQTLMGLLGVGAQYGVLLPYNRLQESEADLLGLDLMAKAGFDPAQSLELWRNMDRAGGGAQPVEFLSTHPSHSTRMQDLAARIPAAKELQRQAIATGKSRQCEGLQKGYR